MLCAGGSASVLYRVYWDARYDLHTVCLKIKDTIMSFHKELEIFWWFSVQFLTDVMQYNCDKMYWAGDGIFFVVRIGI